MDGTNVPYKPTHDRAVPWQHNGITHGKRSSLVFFFVVDAVGNGLKVGLGVTG